jgi:dehydrogenase/reductase SDR family protein 7B
VDFAGQVIWITGASSGIGEASARAFAAAGAHVILSSRRPAELERVRLSLPEPDRHRVLPLDLARPESFPAAVAAALAHWDHVDVLVNNGGVSQRALALETEATVERALMEVDYFGPVALTKALLPAMLARRRGHVVVVSSVMGYLGTPGRSTYAAAKHALHGYFDSLRAEVWREGIRVTLVCPGYVRTAVGRNALGPRGETRDATPHGITPERCARALLRGVARGRAEVHVGGWEIAGIYLQRLAPGLLRWLVRRMTFTVHPGR